MTKAILGTLGLAGVCLFPLIGLAQPSATYSLNTIIYEPNTISDPVSGTAGSTPLNISSGVSQSLYHASASGSATIVGGSDPVLTATAVNGGEYAVATATLDYYFQVNSSGSANVPLDIAGTYIDSDGTYSAGSAIITSQTTYSSGGGIYVFRANISGSGYSSDYTTSYLGQGLQSSGSLTGNDTINWATTIYVVPNQVFELELYVNTNSEGGGTATAELDPTVGIDPTFLAANPGDTMSFSPGFSAVPEPSIYALVLGAAALGVAAMRRRVVA